MHRAQASIELLFVVGFAMLLIIPSLALFGRFVQETTYTATSSQIQKIGAQFITTAMQVYYSNDGAIIIIEVNMPNGVQGMEIDEAEDTIIFTTNVEGKEAEQVYFSEVPISGTINSEDYTKGIKKFKLTSSDGTVVISRWIRGESME